MDNPYNDISPAPSSITFSKRLAVGIIIFFGLGVIAIPIWRHITELQKDQYERWLPIVELWKPSGQKTLNHFFTKKSKNPAVTREKPNLRDHLQAVESGIKDSTFRKQLQRSEQNHLSTLCKKGNSKVIQGKDGWLYFRPAVESLTGRGPLNPEPQSVTKDPDRPVWNDPLEVIKTFHNQLQERNIELMLVPIPVKPMLEQEGLGMPNQLITHADQDEFYKQLRESGIDVVDLAPMFQQLQNEGQPLYLKQDTHWNADVAKAAAQQVSKLVQQKQWYATTDKFPAALLKRVERSATGDLVGMLNLPENNQAFSKETISFERVLDLDTGRALENNLHSPISLLGDSFVNIYEEPGLGFEDRETDQGLIGGGFGSHLSAALKMRPHIMAINGEGATGVRQAFATLPDNIVRQRKLVIWAIAYRDLFLSETAASRAGVYWQDVSFNQDSTIIEPPIPEVEDEPVDSEFIISAVLSEKSIIEVDPKKTPYPDAVFTTIFKDIEVISGEYYDDEVLVYLWAFRDAKWTPEWSFQAGKRYRLKLTPITKRPAITLKKIFSDFNQTSIEHFFAEEIQLLK